MIRKFLCLIGLHGPIWFGNEWGRCDEPFVRQCPYCGMRWYGTEIDLRDRQGQIWRSIGDWKTRKQCIKSGEWIRDKFVNQKF